MSLSGAITLLPLAAHEHLLLEDFGPLEWGVTILAALVTIWVIWKSVRYTLEPGETEPDHIKRMILPDPDIREDDVWVEIQEQRPGPDAGEGRSA